MYLPNFMIPKTYPDLFKKLKKDKNLATTGSLSVIEDIATTFMSRNDPPAAAYCEIATFLLNSGYPELGKIYFEYSLKLAPLASTYSLYLQCLMLTPSCTVKKMYQKAIGYEKLFLKDIPRYQTHENELIVNRKLNIGHICHFFHNSVSQSLLLPYLKAHNRNRVNIFCYSDTDPHEVADSIKNAADIWRDTKGLNDETLAELIKKDKIDILLELNGHCVINRYLTIARKPAPIQINFYNHFATTGISAIDYLLVGDGFSLSKVKRYYTESIYNFKGVSGIAQFSDDFPEPSNMPPCRDNKYITFGSFGASQKVNVRVVKLWCKLLKKFKNSKFYMKANVLSFEPFRKSYEFIFAKEGISLDRIIFEGFSEHNEMLKCYSRMDIALDTFPHTGGATTREALWQGVPVISLLGKRHSMQHGRAILCSVGHPELIAYSEEDFIHKAIQLASSPERLSHYRRELRNDFKKSPRADVKAFATALEDAYFDIWKNYCNKKSSL